LYEGKSISAKGIIGRPEVEAGISRRGASPREEMTRGQDKKNVEMEDIAGEEKRGRGR